jgi:hypothetical protein
MSDTYSLIDAIVLVKTAEYVIIEVDGIEFAVHRVHCEDFDSIPIKQHRLFEPKGEPIEISLTDEWLEDNDFDVSGDSEV